MINSDKKFKKGGQVMILIIIFFLAASIAISFTLSDTVSGGSANTRNLLNTKKSYFASESLGEDLAYRLKNNLSVPSYAVLSYDGINVGALINTITGGKEIISTSTVKDFVRKVKTKVIQSTGTSFNYGVQSGEGGVVLENSSSIKGNVYSNGPVDGSGSNIIKGDVVSAGPTGLIDGVHATSSAYARTIQNSTVDKDAYYQTKTNTTVGGVSYPGSTDQATSTLPITDAMIQEWEDDALTGGTITTPCPYVVSSNITIGPKKINCDLEIKNNAVVTLTGTLWVKGNVSIENTATMQISSSLSGRSVAVIADDPANRSTKGIITLQNSAQFIGSGTNSYVLFISNNNSAELGGSTKAIVAKNTIIGNVLVYAGHGEIVLENSVDIKEVTAYRIRLKNSAEVLYETGLASLLFSGGPAGGYDIESWLEIE
jgi:hypothetical protein